MRNEVVDVQGALCSRCVLVGGSAGPISVWRPIMSGTKCGTTLPSSWLLACAQACRRPRHPPVSTHTLHNPLTI